MSTEKQALPVFLDEQGEPIAILCFVNGERILFKVDRMSEDEIIALYEKKDTIIKNQVEL